MYTIMSPHKLENIICEMPTTTKNQCRISMNLHVWREALAVVPVPVAVGVSEVHRTFGTGTEVHNKRSSSGRAECSSLPRIENLEEE